MNTTMMRLLVLLVSAALMTAMASCALCDGEHDESDESDETFCPEPRLEHPESCSFYLQHSEEVPNLLCRVSNGFHDPILTSPPVLVDKLGLWVTSRRRTDDRGKWCGRSFGVVVDQQYRPGWKPGMPDCMWVACTEFAEISPSP